MSVCHTQSSQDTLPLFLVVGGDFVMSQHRHILLQTIQMLQQFKSWYGFSLLWCNLMKEAESLKGFHECEQRQKSGFFAGFLCIPIHNTLSQQKGTTLVIQQEKDFYSKQKILHLNCAGHAKKNLLTEYIFSKGQWKNTSGSWLHLQESAGGCPATWQFCFPSNVVWVRYFTQRCHGQMYPSSVKWDDLDIYIKKKYHSKGCAVEADTAQVCCTHVTNPCFRSDSLLPKFVLQTEPHCTSVVTSFHDKVASL